MEDFGSCVNQFFVLPGESSEKEEAGADNSVEKHLFSIQKL
jgi:hypothetical protein